MAKATALIFLVFMSADIMATLCRVCVCISIRVHKPMNKFSSKNKRPRDMLFLLKDTSSIKDEKIVQGMQICMFVCFLEPLQVRYPHPKCENFNILLQFFSLTIERISLLCCMYVVSYK